MRLACLKSLTTLLAGVALLASSEVGAQITYNVNLGIGGGTAVGQITTNGTIGSVGAADLTSFSILLSPSPGSQFTLTNFNAGVEGTQNLLASASELSFDFSSMGYWMNGWKDAPPQQFANGWVGRYMDTLPGASTNASMLLRKFARALSFQASASRADRSKSGGSHQRQRSLVSASLRMVSEAR